MKKVLLFGSTGNLGKAIAREALRQSYELTAVVRSQAKAMEMKELCHHHLITGDITSASSLSGICEGFDVVISALGKSVSPNDFSKPGFREIDFEVNSLILAEALKSKVGKFIYISAFHAERYPELAYFKAHHDFSEKLIQSGLNYSVIKPPAIFSAFKDIIEMAKKGILVNLGKGDKLTNPIHEGDLAKVVMGATGLENQVIEAGGKEIYSRKQLNEIIRDEIRPGKRLYSVPLQPVRFFLPLLKLIDKNAYDKFAFFIKVTEHTTVAPLSGEMRFEDYVRLHK